ncbi:MAG TPA: hypothetical protein VGC54_08025 [Planctomycetota bacterium]
MRFAIPFLLLLACSTSASRYRYEPALVENVVASGNGERVARVLVRVNGVQPADASAGTPAGIELRLRIENPGAIPLRMESGGLRLSTGDLKALPAVLLDGSLPLVVPPGEELRLLALFPFPAGRVAADLDLSVLDLAWRLERGAERLDGSATFERASWRRYPRSWDRSAWYWCGYHGYSHAWQGHASCSPWFPRSFYY